MNFVYVTWFANIKKTCLCIYYVKLHLFAINESVFIKCVVFYMYVILESVPLNFYPTVTGRGEGKLYYVMASCSLVSI